MIFFNAATIVLSSTAGAAEHQGSKLGEYVEAGEHEGRPYFRQRDTRGSADMFLYSEGGKWRASGTLGGTGGNLRNNQSTSLPPTDQWHYYSDNDTWNSDTSLTLEFNPLSPCQLIKVVGEGVSDNSLGDYR